MSEPPKPEPAGFTPAGAVDEPVPKLPRGRGLKLSGPELFRIALTLVALIGVIVLTRPCAHAVSGFVTSFDNGSNAKAMPKPGNVDVPAPAQGQQYETLKPGMTDEEIKAAIERAKARAAGSGSPAPGPAPAPTATGSAAPPPAPAPDRSAPAPDKP